ncbi:MAG: alpha-galactosidase [Lachnospiraceae bacterium]|nr:alpha-galactosidase [Lachnospiraceae bacterium]
MIYEENKHFILSTDNTSYAFFINELGLPEHLHYGKRLNPGENNEDFFRALKEKYSHGKGTTTNYVKDNEAVLEDMLLEMSSVGKGDIREPFVIIKYPDGSRTSDFIYKNHEITDGPVAVKTMPSAYSETGAKTLKLVLEERVNPVELILYYTVFEKADVISRRAVLVNKGDEDIFIEKIMSTQLDLDSMGLKVTSFGGNWTREMERFETVLNHGTFTVSSRAGVSSNRSNPFVMLSEAKSSETFGESYGFNLIYSGNHYEAFEVSGFGKTRFVSGINPEGFEWKLENGGEFETPEAVMTYSPMGYRAISKNMHYFVRQHIVRGEFKNKPRPILLNSWEAAYFNISEHRLLNLAKKAQEAGIELFVMDDGWFKGRNSDKSSLGDWVVDKKKLPGGLSRLSKKIHDLGLDFGIWVEPEMINEDSDLFRAHPEYAMTIPGRDNSLGRNQMFLDLTNPEVVEYVKASMRDVFKTEGLNYVKWDMNRMFSDVFSKVLDKDRQGETLHRYYMGLYDIMGTLTREFPHILFEGCASGGNRTDLGILSYFPQIWGSDDTDAIERTGIQEGLSYGYPLSTVTAHVSGCPNHQTLRNTPMETRFNVAAFGVLGYEINLTECSKDEFEAIKQQIEIYKKWRDVFFGGDFYRLDEDKWMVVSSDQKKAVAMSWNKLCKPNDFYLKLQTTGLNPEYTYHVYNIPMKYNLKLFGDLVNQVAPIHVKKDSFLHNTLARFIKMDGEKEDYRVSGELLNNSGIKLTQAFGGTGYNGETRLYQDFYSRMYFFESI